MISLVVWYLLQNTEATALTAKHLTDFALRQLDCKQHGEHRTARYPVIVSFWETIYSSYNICSNSHFLPGVLSPVCANSIFNCEHIELANCSSAMLQLVNSTHRKPRAQSPSIGIIMQRTLPISEFSFTAGHPLALERHAGYNWRAARDVTQTEENTHERTVARILFDSIYHFSQQENITRVVI